MKFFCTTIFLILSLLIPEVKAFEEYDNQIKRNMQKKKENQIVLEIWRIKNLIY